MLGRSHLLLGAAAGAVVAQQIHVPLVAGVVVGGLAALTPDADHPGSVLGKLLPKAYHRLTPGHRGPSHSLVWCALVGLAVSFWSEPLALLAMVGAVSHLAADGLTTAGVPWIWPLSKQRLALPHWLAIRTGGWAEGLVVVGVLAGAGWWMAGR